LKFYIILYFYQVIALLIPILIHFKINIAFDLNNKLNRINCLNFSIPFDESHLFSIPKYNEDPSKKKKLDKMDTISVSIDRNSTLTTNTKIDLSRNETSTVTPFSDNNNNNNRSCGSLELTKSPLLDSEKKPKSLMAKICWCFYPQ
jgi:hypothetical protein